MAKTVAQQMARLQIEVQNLQAQLHTRTPVTKDLSLVALVPKWSGPDKAVPLHEFFKTIESTGKIGNWTQEDVVRIATLKLTDVARAFYNGTLELYDQRITWAAYKTAFHNRFRDCVRNNFTFHNCKWRGRRKMSPPGIRRWV